MVHLQKGIPVLASLDIDKTIAVYKEKLGFDKLGFNDQDSGMRELAVLDLDGNLIKFGQVV